MPGNPLTDPNWASDTTDTVVRLVGTVREQTTTKAVFAARGLVFGIIAAFLGVFIVVITHHRADARAPGAARPRRRADAQAVYLSYFIVGGILCLGGLLLFKKRNASTG